MESKVHGAVGAAPKARSLQQASGMHCKVKGAMLVGRARDWTSATPPQRGARQFSPRNLALLREPAIARAIASPAPKCGRDSAMARAMLEQAAHRCELLGEAPEFASPAVDRTGRGYFGGPLQQRKHAASQLMTANPDDAAAVFAGMLGRRCSSNLSRGMKFAFGEALKAGNEGAAVAPCRAHCLRDSRVAARV